MASDDPQLSPGAWLEFLNKKLDEQWRCIEEFDDYYNGEHKLSFATAKFREAFARYFPPMANNWMKLVVDAPTSRLKVMGFRMNPDPNKPDWDQVADEDAWGFWQANSMDMVSRMVHLDAIKLSIAHVMVSPPTPENNDKPLITPEHPSQCYVYLDPANRRRRLAAIKRWVDEIDEKAYATIYLPDEIIKFESVEKWKVGKKISWRRRSDDPGGKNPIGVVPIIPIENTPDMTWGGRSDLEVAIPIQDAINKLCLDMQVSSEYHAFPQRYATGWETATDANGKPLTAREVEVATGQSRMIRAQSPETKFGQFAPGDVNNYIVPIEMYVDHLAAMTQTPAYYLKGKMANMSADALHAADAGLVDRCMAKIEGGFSDGWEEVIRTAFLADGDKERGKAFMAEAIWDDPETKSLAQVTDAAVKWRTQLSVPLEVCWQLLGFSPQQIQMVKEMMGLPESPAKWNELNQAGLNPIDDRGFPVERPPRPGFGKIDPRGGNDPNSGGTPGGTGGNVTGAPGGGANNGRKTSGVGR